MHRRRSALRRTTVALVLVAMAQLAVLTAHSPTRVDQATVYCIGLLGRPSLVICTPDI